VPLEDTCGDRFDRLAVGDVALLVLVRLRRPPRQADDERFTRAESPDELCPDARGGPARSRSAPTNLLATVTDAGRSARRWRPLLKVCKCSVAPGLFGHRGRARPGLSARVERSSSGLSRRPSEADEHEECDVADREGGRSGRRTCPRAAPRIDLLVNNAGVGARGNYLDADPEVIERVIRVNYLGSVWDDARVPPRPRQRLASRQRRLDRWDRRDRTVLGVEARAARLLTFESPWSSRRGGISVHTVNPGFVETEGFRSAGRFGPLFSRLVIEPSLVAERLLDAV